MPPPVVNKQRAPRADAAENRQQIIKTAAQMFAKDGPTISIEAIAKRAGLGIGTMYRHFPTKDALISAIVTSYIERMTTLAQELLTAEPMAALRTMAETLVIEGARKKDFVAAIGGYEKIMCPALDSTKVKFKAALAKIVQRAQAAGVLRKDVTPTDVFTLVNAINMTDADEKCRLRHLDIVLAGLEAR